MKKATGLLGVGLLCCSLAPPLNAEAGQQVTTLNVSAVPQVPTDRVYITRPSAGEDEWIALRNALKAGGAEKINYFVDAGVIGCELPVASELYGEIGRRGFSYTWDRDLTAVSPQQRFSTSMGDDPVTWAKSVYDGAAALATGEIPQQGELEDRVIMPPPEVVEQSYNSSLLYGGDPQGRTVQQNSEFLIGDIVSILVFPESNGGTENWTDKELQDCTTGAAQACLSLQQEFAYLPMSFTFVTHRRVSTQYEPIKHTMDTDADTWILETIHNLGYASPRADLATHELNVAMRKRYGSDWVWTSYIADSRNEPGHNWAGGTAGYTAYANLGGPYMVVPFPSGAYNPNDLSEIDLYSRTFNHEMGHCFWTLDEYAAAPTDCDAHSGYLNYENGNKVGQFPGPDGEDVGCHPLVPCIMRNPRIPERPWCVYSKGMMGTIDANENGIPDIFDRSPTVAYEGGDIDTVETEKVTIRAKAISRAVPNSNPFINEFKTDYAAPLKSATFSVDGVGNARLTPVDGKWDEGEEDLALVLNGLNAGLTTVQLKVVNEFGATSPLIEKEIYFIGIKFDQFAFHQVKDPSPGIRMAWRTVGYTFLARFDVHRINHATGEDAVIEAAVWPSNPGDYYRNYEIVDSDIVQGEEYTYYVQGNFTVGGKAYTPQSQHFTQRAMLPITSGVVSNLSPNPFAQSTSISIDVPRTFDSSGLGLPQEVETDVAVTVYDVQGRLIKKVYQGSFFGRIQTFTWDGTNANNVRVPSGVYFVRARAGGVNDVKKVVLVR